MIDDPPPALGDIAVFAGRHASGEQWNEMIARVQSDQGLRVQVAEIDLRLCVGEERIERGGVVQVADAQGVRGCGAVSARRVTGRQERCRNGTERRPRRQNRFFVSSKIVTGPSLTNSTRICAPKIPYSTGTPERSKSAPTSS